MEDINPYKILKLSKDFTLDELKSNYKREVLKHHPDKSKSIATTPQFQILTACYKMLLAVHQQRASRKEFQELKQSYQNDEPVRMAAPTGRFNLSRFNEDFEKYKFKDKLADDGYEEWIKSTVKGDTVIKPKVDIHAVQKYREPLPFQTGGGAYYPLGQEKLADYSGENIRNKDLQYMDFKLAHSTERIIDPSVVKQRKDFRSVEELEAYRAAQLDRPQSAKDIARQKKQEILQQRKEEERLERLRQYNALAEEFHRKTFGLLTAGQSTR